MASRPVANSLHFDSLTYSGNDPQNATRLALQKTGLLAACDLPVGLQWPHKSTATSGNGGFAMNTAVTLFT